MTAQVDLSKTVGLYAQLDPETGDQWLITDHSCKPAAHTKTKVRPAKSVPRGELTLIDGYQGRVRLIQINRGLMLPRGDPNSTGSCGLSGQKLSE